MLRRGHAGGHLRDPLDDYLDSHMFKKTKGWYQKVEVDGEKKPIRWLIGQLWNCTDAMPSSNCDQLDLVQGSTYAQGVRALRSQLEG